MYNNVQKLPFSPNFYESGNSSDSSTEECEATASLQQTLESSEAEALVDMASEVKRIIEQCSSIVSLEPKISIEQAKEILLRLTHGIDPSRLRVISILFVEMRKILRAIKLDSGMIGDYKFAIRENSMLKAQYSSHKELCDEMSGKLLSLFKICENHKTWQELNEIPTNLKDLIFDFLHLGWSQLLELAEGNYNTKGKLLCHKFKEMIDLFYYIFRDEVFYNICSSTSFHKKNDAECTISILQLNVDLYLDSVDEAFQSLILFKQQIEKKFLAPLKQGLQEINNLPSSHQAKYSTLKNALTLFLENLQNRQGSIEANFQLLSRMFLAAKTNKENVKLQNLLGNLAAGTSSMIEIFNQIQESIVPLWIEPWDSSQCESYEEKMTHCLSEIDHKLQSPLAKALKMSSHNKKIYGKLHVALQTVQTECSKEKYLNIYQELITTSKLFSVNIALDLAKFCQKMVPVNMYAMAFHEVLSKSLEFNYAFEPINLLCYFIKIFANVKTETLKLVTGFIKATTPLLKGPWQPFLLPQPNENKMTKLSEFASTLRSVCGLLILDIDRVKAPQAFEVFRTLYAYLDEYLKFPVMPQHLLQTLVQPISKRDELIDEDLLLIKHHFADMAASCRQADIDSKLMSLQEATKSKVDLAPAVGKHFWKLNSKYVSLAGLECQALKVLIGKMNDKIQSCYKVKDVLPLLHAWFQEYSKIEKSLQDCSLQIDLLSKVAENKELDELSKPLQELINWCSWMVFLSEPLKKCVQHNHLPNEIVAPRKSSSKRITGSPKLHKADRRQTPPRENEHSVIANVSDNEPVSLPADLPRSQFSEQCDMLNQLKNRPLLPIHSKENQESYSLRTLWQRELIDNSFFHLTLLEESRQWNVVENESIDGLAGKLQTNYLLLLEATEKIILCSSRISTQQAPDKHIATSAYNQRPLIYTHQGELLVSCLNIKAREWFADVDIESWVQQQEPQLIKSHWFHEEQHHLQGIAQLRNRCECIWQQLLGSSSKTSKGPSSMLNQANSLVRCRTRTHKLKRDHMPQLPNASFPRAKENFQQQLELLIADAPWDAQCLELAKGIQSALTRVLNWSDQLHSYRDLQNMPLFFAVRSAEIQVSLLSLTIQLILCALEWDANDPHPLYLDAHGNDAGSRPLFHCHRVDQLYAVLKRHDVNQEHDIEKQECLKEYLPLFLGDPRYPFPNKSALTNELITAFQKVYLQHKLAENDFFNDEDIKLLNQHVGANGRHKSAAVQSNLLEQGIVEGIKRQQQRTELAFYLAGLLLELYR